MSKVLVLQINYRSGHSVVAKFTEFEANYNQQTGKITSTTWSVAEDSPCTPTYMNIHEIESIWRLDTLDTVWGIV